MLATTAATVDGDASNGTNRLALTREQDSVAWVSGALPIASSPCRDSFDVMLDDSGTVSVSDAADVVDK